MEKQLVKVAASSNPGKVAGYLAHLFTEVPARVVEVRTIGKRAGEIAVKAVEIAGIFLEGEADLTVQTETSIVALSDGPFKATSLIVYQDI